MCLYALICGLLHAGVLQYEVKLLLKHCIQHRYFTLSTLSTLIAGIELGYMEKDNRPTPLTSKILSSNDNKLSQNGGCMNNIIPKYN